MSASERLAQLGAHLTQVGGSLQDKVCIITGAGSIYGIGRSTAFALAKRGAKAIYVTDLTINHLEELAKEIEATYPTVRCVARAVDAASSEDVEHVIEEALSTFGRLDVFFANAGKATGTHISQEDAASFTEMMRVNALSVFLAIKHAGAAMQVTGKSGKEASGGSIIATASVAGIRSGAGSPEYSASKAAVINLCQTGAYQYAGKSIRINAICPGLIETGMTKIVFDQARARKMDQKIGQLNPSLRPGLSMEVASVVASLASDETSYVNGQCIAVDGGLSASLPIVPGKFY
ncbi:hypothetical protein BDF14DRAFT_1780736 [Spinellus fusiger]|nr:hypothetical protein BDF14DRAFT_1780736 [Spinellus fusiger]